MTSSRSIENDKHRSPKDGELSFQTKSILFSLFESKCNMEFQQFHEHSYFYYSRRNCYQFWLSQPILQTSSTSRGRAILAATQEIHEHFCFYYSSRNCYQFLAHTADPLDALYQAWARYTSGHPHHLRCHKLLSILTFPQRSFRRATATIFQTRYSGLRHEPVQRSEEKSITRQTCRRLSYLTVSSRPHHTRVGF